MTKTTLSTLYLVLLSLLFTSDLVALPTPISFQELSFAEVQSKASQQKKHFFAYIYGDWCLSCQVMEESTFTDQKLVSYINDEFLPVKVDIHSALGKEWDNEFHISAMPTFLIFDQNGQLIKRYERTFTGNSLYEALYQSTCSNLTTVEKDEPPALLPVQNNIAHKNNTDTVDQMLTSYLIEQLENLMLQKEQLMDEPVLSEEQRLQVQSEAPINSSVNEAILQLVDDGAISALQITDSDCQEILSNPDHLQVIIAALRATQSENNNTYTETEAVIAAIAPLSDNYESPAHSAKIKKVKKMYSNGSYKIELGQYTDYYIAAKLVNHLKAKFEKDVFLLIDKKGTYKTYRVLVSDFEDDKEANDFLQYLRDKGYTSS